VIARIVLIAGCLLTGALIVLRPSDAIAATQAQLDAARNKGLAWLISHQHDDGSWRGPSGSEVATTATAVEALNRAGLKSYPYAASVSWLGNASVASVDSMARRVLALRQAGVTVTTAVEQLKAWRNTSLTWGAYSGFDTSFPDTPLTLGAIRQSQSTYSNQDLASGLCAIVVAQKTGDASVLGSWSYIRSGPTPAAGTTLSAILPTVHNVLELDATRVTKGWSGLSCGGTSYTLATVVTNGLTWLLSRRRNADGGFGEPGMSTVSDTAIVYHALNLLRPADPAIGTALDYLIGRQQADGSWAGGALPTSLVLKALPAPSTPLADTDKDGLPNAIELLLGKNPNVADSRWLTRNPASGAGVSSTVASGGDDTHRAVPVATTVIRLSGTAGVGDLTGDGRVDAADVGLAERIAVGLIEPTREQLQQGDLMPATRPDGIIDVADVARLRRAVLGFGERTPER
jgi:hypothetical protein